MKRRISITLDIDPTEYNGCEDTPLGAIDLIAACLRNEADLPTYVTIACENETQQVALDDGSL